METSLSNGLGYFKSSQKVYIQRSEKKFHATSIKKQTNNPTFEESFTFQLPKHELSNQSIRLDVLSIEKTKRTLLIGYVSFPLAVINQTGSQWRPMRVARDLQLCDSSNVPGNILLVVALTYFPSADRLTVGLFECHNLPLKASGLPINKPVAIVVLGNEMVSKGNGISHWASVMEHPELTVTECHELQPL
uniref:C2 domain-containing protein n=1 Tax=Mesocestoides corti TaxID=53468 RepID=A0A5K3ENR0_MESCO